jgi:sarcosine oxidase
VTVLEQYTPGHVRAASGGENRLIRFSHGADDWYTRSAKRALELWRELEAEANAELFVPSGVAWFFAGSQQWAKASERALTEARIDVEQLTPQEAGRLFPSFDPAGLESVLYEPGAGALRARDATRVLVEQAVVRGARFRHERADPSRPPQADHVIWACGPWLARLFPELVQLQVTRQEVFFFGSPPEWQAPAVPAWVDFDAGIYGVGDVDGRGFKASPDEHGPEFDPDGDDRVVSAEKEQAAREYLSQRFPALAGAPLVGTRACPYSLTADQNFVVAPHPEHDHVWLLGGGSGHGFKHGPALAEHVERLLKREEPPDPRFRLGPREGGGSLRTAGGRPSTTSPEAADAR